MLTAFHEAVCFGGMLEGEGFVDNGFILSRAYEWIYILVNISDECFLKSVFPAAQGTASDGEALLHYFKNVKLSIVPVLMHPYF